MRQNLGQGVFRKVEGGKRKTLGEVTVFLTVPGSKDESILTIGEEKFGTHIYSLKFKCFFSISFLSHDKHELTQSVRGITEN
jgi:hypothetical protein